MSIDLKDLRKALDEKDFNSDELALNVIEGFGGIDNIKTIGWCFHNSLLSRNIIHDLLNLKIDSVFINRFYGIIKFRLK